ncbi:MAG: magnesium/cobalt transporter CorA [Vicinamibacteria bacterium]|jgi:magnesium transporter|nr:magnesium/cobalt transporter CorA [Vicinamibacteria bacterium]
MLTYMQCQDGVVTECPFNAETYQSAPQALHWIDLEDPTPEEILILENPFHFHPLAIDDCMTEINHPKADDYESYLFLIVHGLAQEKPEDPLVIRELDVFLGPRYIVTYHRGAMRSIGYVREQCRRGLNAAFVKGADYLLYQVLDQVFSHFMPTLNALEDRIQLIQVEVFESPSRETLDRIFAMKNDVLSLRRTCAPQRDLVNRLGRGEFDVISQKTAPYFRDVYDALYRIVETSYSYQDLVQGTLDAYLSSINNRLNETMKRLTVIGALLMPLTVITSLYGMNFEHMPELHWRYGYFMVLFAMALISGGLLYWFRRNQWI